ncbi:aldo/keto reductase [Prosthecomicrobium sp. N25]|uniref:aldo/keto reductase n=1 Tax=Prosthecomicrobium sp. N25 TaxID=3129254 RepID=UPI00307804C7
MIRLPEIGVGCAALSIVSPETGDEAAVELLVRAYDHGIRYFDVAPLYGGGRGEVLLGRALGRMGGPVAVSTKVGYAGAIPYGGRQAPEDRRKDFSPDAIERGVIESLRRLGRDVLDILYLHDPPADLHDIEGGALPRIERLREQGLIRAIGVGTSNAATAQAVLERLPLEVLLLAGRFTLIDRTGAGVVARCHAMGVSLVVGGVFNSGLLAAARPAAGGSFDYGPAPEPMIARAVAAERICKAAGIPLKAAALQFARRQPGVATTLLGPRTRGELDDLMALLALPVPRSLWSELDRIGAGGDPPC